MGKASNATAILSTQAKSAIWKLGGDLRIARERRGESLRSWAPRMGVSVPTLQRMEKGDPSVSMAVYVTALWLSGMLPNLADAADPAKDEFALSLDIEKSSKKRLR